MMKFIDSIFFDIETGGLESDSPIYELGFHEPGKETPDTHRFVRPTAIGSQETGAISEFTNRLLAKRGITVDQLMQSEMGQTQSAQFAYDQLAGKDVWVQNLRHERSFLKERVGRNDFNAWAIGSKMESYTPGSGLFTTTPSIKKAIHQAQGRQNSLIYSQQQYLEGWRDVYGAFKDAMDPQNRVAGTTRVFDTMDLTKSVYGMAQAQGYMKKTGDVFTGSSVDVLSRAFFDHIETHTALEDAQLQHRLTDKLMDVGERLYSGEGLSVEDAGALHRIGETQGALKEASTKRNLLDTWLGQLKFKQTGDYSHLSRSRVNFAMEDISLPLRVRQEDGSYVKEMMPFRRRKRMDFNSGAYADNMDDVIEAWSQRDRMQHGQAPDYKSIWGGLKSSGLDDLYQGYQSGEYDLSGLEKRLEGFRESAYTSASEKAKVGLKSSMPSPTKLLVGAAAVGTIAAFNLFGGPEDFNTVEGMQSGGLGGLLRHEMTAFGSPWKGLADSLSKDFTGQMSVLEVADYRVEDGDTVDVLLADGTTASIRMAGLDAPEGEHDKGGLFSFGDAQPFAEESTEMLEDLIDENDRLMLLVDPTASSTYGRVVGTLAGEETGNINLEMLRRGGASFLPFGKKSDRMFDTDVYREAMEAAQVDREGMWGETAWQRLYGLQQETKSRGMTHTTMQNQARLESQNFQRAAMAMRFRHTEFGASDMTQVGGTSDSTVAQGLSSGVFGASVKHRRTSELANEALAYVHNQSDPSIYNQSYKG